MRYTVTYPSGERARWVGPNEGQFDSLPAAVECCVREAPSVGTGGLGITDRFNPAILITITAYKEG